MLTNYCEKIRSKYNLAIGQVEKLHYINFQLFLDLGLKIRDSSSIRIQLVSIAKTVHRCRNQSPS